MLSRKRDTNSAERFFRKDIKQSKDCLPCNRINTDKYPVYIKAISNLQAEGIMPKESKHTQIKYLNNGIESDHFRLKKHMKLINTFQNFYSASRTIKGIESMLTIKKKQCSLMNNQYIETIQEQKKERILNRR